MLELLLAVAFSDCIEDLFPWFYHACFWCHETQSGSGRSRSRRVPYGRFGTFQFHNRRQPTGERLFLFSVMAIQLSDVVVFAVLDNVPFNSLLLLP